LKKFALIVAGGSGNRMNSAIPKQFINIAGKPILIHTIEKFLNYSQNIKIVLVIPKIHTKLWSDLCKQHKFNIRHQIVGGGDTRFISVKNGLNLIDDSGLVSIHDGVRPMVNTDTISRVFKVANLYGNAIPAIPVIDSIRQTVENKNTAIDRQTIQLIQTPQCFKVEIIKKAYLQKYCTSFTDDASVVEAMGEKINIVEGNVENIKITTPFDLKIAETVLSTDSNSFL